MSFLDKKIFYSQIRVILISVFITFCLLSCDLGEKKDPEAEEVKKMFFEANKLYKEKEFTKAIRLYTKVIRKDPEHAMAYLKRGDSKRKIRRARQAIRDYNKSIQLRPSNARAYYHRGTLNIKLGKKREGCEDVEKAKALCYVPAEQFFKKFCEK